MDYKQKYEDALERARKEYKNHEAFKGFCEMLVHIFPELKESEDEKIRNCIGICLTDVNEQRFKDFSTTLKDCLAWLEKQDEQANPYSGISFEYNGHTWGMCARDNGVDILLDKQLFKHLEKQGGQKPTDKVEPKFKVGDIIINEHGFIMQIDGIDSNMYGYHVLDGSILLKHNITKIDESCHLWTIRDAKDGDIIASNPIIILFKKFQGESDCNNIIAHVGIDLSGTLQITDELWSIDDNAILATKEQRDLLFQKMREAGYEWDAEKKELKKIELKQKQYDIDILEKHITKDSISELAHTVIVRNGWEIVDAKEQKPAEWSERDEEVFHCLEYTVKHYYDDKDTINKCCSWLKSLRKRMKGE